METKSRSTSTTSMPVNLSHPDPTPLGLVSSGMPHPQGYTTWIWMPINDTSQPSRTIRLKLTLATPKAPLLESQLPRLPCWQLGRPANMNTPIQAAALPLTSKALPLRATPFWTELSTRIVRCHLQLQRDQATKPRDSKPSNRGLQPATLRLQSYTTLASAPTRTHHQVPTNAALKTALKHPTALALLLNANQLNQNTKSSTSSHRIAPKEKRANMTKHSQ